MQTYIPRCLNCKTLKEKKKQTNNQTSFAYHGYDMTVSNDLQKMQTTILLVLMLFPRQYT